MRTFRSPYAAIQPKSDYSAAEEYQNRQRAQRAIPTPFVQAVSGDTVLTAQDDSGWFLVDATSAAVTLTLPIASTAPAMTVTVKKTDSSANGVVVSRSGTDTIDGATSTTVSAQYATVTLRSTGADGTWELLTPATAGTAWKTGNIQGGGLAQQSGLAAGFSIFTPSSDAGVYRLLITGKDASTGGTPSNVWYDEVVLVPTAGWAPVVVSSTTVVGTPGGRTYTNSTGALQVAVASGTVWYVDVCLVKFDS